LTRQDHYRHPAEALLKLREEARVLEEPRTSTQPLDEEDDDDEDPMQEQSDY